MNNTDYNETWKDIPGFNGRYQASTLGRIRSMCWKRTNNKVVILTPNLSGRYARIHILPNGIPGTKPKAYLVHRLVAMTYCSNLDPKSHKHVNHKNGMKEDNRPENLEWVTDSYNVLHSYDTGLNPHIGERNHKCKVKSVDLERIFQLRSEGLTLNAIAKLVGTDSSSVFRILSGKYRKRETIDLRLKYNLYP